MRRVGGLSLTMVVSVTEPKLLMKMLHVTLTGGPVRKLKEDSWLACYKAIEA